MPESDLPPASFPEGAPPPPEPERSIASRVFWRVFSVAAILPFVLVKGGYAMPGAGESLIVLGLAAVVLGPLLCLVMAAVLSIRGRKEAAKGWLLGGLAAPVVGFGSCVLGFFVGA